MHTLIQAIELLVAVVLVVLGLSYLLRSADWLNFLGEAFEHPHRLFPLAIGMVCTGTIIAIAYDDWSSTWPIFVTILGWLMAAEGAFILLFPNWVRKFSQVPDSIWRWYLKIGGVIITAIGAGLFGFAI